MKLLNKNIAKYIILLSMISILLPICIFLIGFTKWYIALIGIVLILFGLITYSKKDFFKYSYKMKNKKYYLIVFVVILIWVLFSGVGAFSYQNSDFNVRNAVLRDLIQYDWPIYFNMQELLGVEKVGFVYYFTYWMIPAIVGKVFGILAANIFLVLYTCMLLFLVYMLLELIFKKSSYWILTFLVLFSGFDAVGYLLSTGDAVNIFGINHIEWWSTYFQYSSNTTQLYWVFNQSIPIWIITSLLLLNDDSRYIGFIGASAFCYSPFATFGVIPYAIYFMVKSYNRSLKNIFTIHNCVWPLFLLITFGSFYLSADSSVSVRGFILCFTDWSLIKFVMKFCLFFVLEVGIYFMITYKTNRKNPLYWLTFVLLFFIPFYKMTPANDFCMRSSISALFILMIFVIDFFMKVKFAEFEMKLICTIIICVSSLNPIHEISRSIYNTTTYSRAEYLQELVYSVGSPKDAGWFEICKQQFYAKNLKHSIFYKYIVK